MKKYISLLFLVFVFTLSLIPKTALADGMVIMPDPYYNRWNFTGEDSQQAFINYENGVEKMVVSVGMNADENDGVVWLFPVPADSKKVVIDVVDSLPYLSGREITDRAKDNLNNSSKALIATQLYTIPLILGSDRYPSYSGDTVVPMSSSLNGSKSSIEDVVVVEHIDKDGITSEIITAKTAKGLYDYLNEKGLKIETGSIPVLDNYIGKDYTFVTSWISKPKSITTSETDEKGYTTSICKCVTPSIYSCCGNNDYYNQRGVFVTFPTDKIYFPLLPTSVYGSKTVPATIKVIGHVTPNIFNDIKSYTETNYFIDESVSSPTGLETFFGNNIENVKYTQIDIKAPSKMFTDDLWIYNKAPVKTYYSSFIAEHWIITTLIVLVISSVVSGIIAGEILFKDQRKNVLKLGLIGLANCLSILGLVAATISIGTKVRNGSDEMLLAEIKRRGYFWKRMISKMAFMISLILIVLGLIQLSESDGIIYIGNFSNIAASLIFYILPFAAIVVGFLFRQIKPQDNDLFIELNSIGYSSWSLKPKDNRKIAFVALFSVTFLIISYLIILLLKMTV